MMRVSRGFTVSAWLAVLTIAGAAGAEDAGAKATFTKDVLPILQENCQTCHRPSGLDLGGMVAPMSLMTFEEVRPWAKSIARVVQTGEMPPWDASHEFNGVFANERTLTQEEINTIVEWVKSGAPRGRKQDAPDPISFTANPHGWHLAEEPDLVISLPEKIWVGDDVSDWQPMYRVPLTADLLPEDRWIKAVEFKPGSDVVHHIVGYAAAPGQRGGSASGAGMLGGIAPGSELDVHPEGFGMRLYKGSNVMISMHYHKEAGPGTGAWDQSSMAMWFHDKPVRHDVRWQAAGSFNFEIPPNHPNWRIGTEYTFKDDSLLLAVSPHMHFRGKAAQYVAYYPDGTNETLLDVPTYDYNWQTHYVYNDPKFIPAGTRLEAVLWYDNSEANPGNPDPNATVRFGERTDDEMAFGWFNYTNAEPLEEGELVPANSGVVHN